MTSASTAVPSTALSLRGQLKAARALISDQGRLLDQYARVIDQFGTTLGYMASDPDPKWRDPEMLGILVAVAHLAVAWHHYQEVSDHG